MGDTSIEWTDKTWNPVRGCSRVSEGCRHCYAETVAARFSGPGQPYEGLAKMVKRDVRQFESVGGEPTGNFRTVSRSEARWTGAVRFVPEHLADPLRWTKPRKIFVNSMSDLFHESLEDRWIDEILAVMLLAHWHTYQVLTKRVARMLAYLSDPGLYARVLNAAALLRAQFPRRRLDQVGISNPTARPAPWIWWGASVENQEAADERIPLLLKTPAAVRFLSCEPLLGSLDIEVHLRRMLQTADGRLLRNTDAGAADTAGVWRRPVDWVIAGCESGRGARPAQVDWYRSLRDQCAAAGVPFFLKQATDVDPAIQPPGGKSPRSGRVVSAPYLDGRQHLEFPAERDEGARGGG